MNLVERARLIFTGMACGIGIYSGLQGVAGFFVPYFLGAVLFAMILATILSVRDDMAKKKSTVERKDSNNPAQ